jgi:hypothetical protein
MQVCQIEVDFAFPYGEGCTPERLIILLSGLAEFWPGWPQFPWRVTRNLHHWLRREEVNFSYLMILRCVTGYAAHLVLTAPFQDREAVLRVMLAMRFEVAGLMRDLLLEAVRGEMLRTRKPYIQDCSGPEDWHEHVEPEEIERRRAAFRLAFEGAAFQFRTILNVAGMTNGRPGTMTLGRRIATWARGVEMPEPERLEVQVENRRRYRILMPSEDEVEALSSAGKLVPRLIEGDLRAAREELRCLGGGKSVGSGQGAAAFARWAGYDALGWVGGAGRRELRMTRIIARKRRALRGCAGVQQVGELLAQHGELVGGNVPDNPVVNAEVAVDQSVAYPRDLAPFDFGMLGLDFVGNLFGRLADDFKAPDKGPLQNRIGVQAFEVPAGKLGLDEGDFVEHVPEVFTRRC